MAHSLSAQAPGKVVLMGDYVVLEGAPALAAAVSQSAMATFVPSGAAGHQFCVEASNLGLSYTGSLADADAQGAALHAAPAPLQLMLRAVCAAVELSGRTLPAGTLKIDTSAFYRDGRKLGLGSSAAALVAAMQALMRAPGLSASVRAHALSQHTLIALHKAWQGARGSGVDVATSLHGGVIRFELPMRDGQRGAGPAVSTPLGPQHGPPYVVVGVGHDSSTAQALAAFERLKQSDARAYWSHMEELAQLSAAACEFWALQQHVAFLPLVRQANAVLSSLGQHMGVDIVSAPHQDLTERVEALGGAYKPSGAGGGDVGVAFFLDAAARRRFVRSLRKTAFFSLGVS